jgi:S1-C subfamily serine protease
MKASTRRTISVWIGAAAISAVSGAIAAVLVFSVLEAQSFQRNPTVYIPAEEDQVMFVVERVLPAVVSIEIVQEGRVTFRSGYPISPIGVGGGTGFFISEDGLVVTNRHVISDTDSRYLVLTQDGRELPATVLALDPALDLGVLKVEGSGFPALELGDSDALKAGQTVIAIGNTLAEFQNSVTKGIVSGLNRSLYAGDFEEEELIEEAIQTDAAINPGNSGGPLITLDGKVVGMNTAVTDGAQSLGFALPSNALARAVESARTHGRILRPWIGVRYIPVDKEIARNEGLGRDYGALIMGNGQRDPGVIPDSPADKADLREGDHILEIDGQRVGDPRSLATIISRLAPEQIVVLKIARDDRELQIPVKLEERPQE